jgi:hypothetical protein
VNVCQWNQWATRSARFTALPAGDKGFQADVIHVRANRLVVRKHNLWVNADQPSLLDRNCSDNSVEWSDPQQLTHVDPARRPGFGTTS